MPQSQFEIVYGKYRRADDDAGDTAWAAKQSKRAVWVPEEEMAQANLSRLELSDDEKALVHVLRYPRRFSDAEGCGALPLKDARRFLRALHAAEILELQDEDKARALVPVEVKRAREQVTGKPSEARKPTSRLRAQVYRPSLDGSEAAPATTAPRRSDTPASTVASSGPMSDADRALEKEIDEAHRAHKKADHFAVLGLKHEASTDEVKKAYFDLAKRFHPDRLAGHCFTDAARTSERMQAVFARISEAYKALLDEDGRRDYRGRLEAGLESAGEEKGGMQRRPGEAQVQYKKGLVFLQKKDFVQARRMFQMAIDLDFGDPTFPAYLAWCDFLDERKPREEREALARTQLTKLVDERPNVHAAYFLGLVLKMAGDDKAAYARFKKVCELDPTHGEAAREVRLYEMRRDRAKTTSGGRPSGKAGGGLLDKLIKR